MLRHFQIDSAGISQVHLINVKNNYIVGDDQDLQERQYFLAFSRIGKQLPSSLNDLDEEQSLPLFQKRLFRRVSTIITIKVGQDYISNEANTPVEESRCLRRIKPRSANFSIIALSWTVLSPTRGPVISSSISASKYPLPHDQAGIRPYMCSRCKKLFRRKICLDKHQSRGTCSNNPGIPLSPLQGQLPEKREVKEIPGLYARMDLLFTCCQCGESCPSF